MVPVAIDALLVDVLEVESVGEGILPVEVHGRHGVDRLHLHDVVTSLTALGQVIGSLVTIQLLGEQPSGLSHPEEGRTVLVLQVASVVGHLELAVLPRQIHLGFVFGEQTSCNEEEEHRQD